MVMMAERQPVTTTQCVETVPDLETLRDGILSVLGGHDGTILLQRKPNHRASTFASEIVTCRMADGVQRRLFCKYAKAHQGHEAAYGYWNDIAYEAEVYRRILQPSGASTPNFYGAYKEAATGREWLVIEYLEECLPVSKGPSGAMALAARWVGQFHAAHQSPLKSFPFLSTYDAEYYAGWARRTLLFADQLKQRFPWLATVCERFEELIDRLVGAPQTIIHGEYYPCNILYCHGRIHPVDWETTAIAAGEIDLAALTDGWPPEITRQCELKYRRARWPRGAHANFEQTLGAARLYVHFRWLGWQPDWTIEQESWRFKRIRAVAEGLGLL